MSINGFRPALFGPAVFPSNFCKNYEKRRRMRAPIGIVECPIQQGLVNGSPDVDAVWRLTFDQEFGFDEAPSVWLAPGAWCPFQ